MKLKITIDNNTYEVDVEVAEPEPVQSVPRGYAAEPAPVRVPAGPSPMTPPAPEGTSAAEDKVCRSPMNGIVVKVAAQAGQSIQPGDILLVLEAMKMETNITSPIAGRIAKVNVNTGESVQGGQVVVEFE